MSLLYTQFGNIQLCLNCMQYIHKKVNLSHGPGSAARDSSGQDPRIVFPLPV